jgi:hypothetical protein
VVEREDFRRGLDDDAVVASLLIFLPDTWSRKWHLSPAHKKLEIAFYVQGGCQGVFGPDPLAFLNKSAQ